MTTKGNKKGSKKASAAAVRGELSRRKRELPAKLKLLKAELDAKIARLRAAFAKDKSDLRARCTVAHVKRTVAR